MKIIRIVSLLSLLCAFFSCHAQDRGFESVSSDAFEKLIADTSVVRLDVRTAEEFEAGISKTRSTSTYSKMTSRRMPSPYFRWARCWRSIAVAGDEVRKPLTSLSREAIKS